MKIKLFKISAVPWFYGVEASHTHPIKLYPIIDYSDLDDIVIKRYQNESNRI